MTDSKNVTVLHSSPESTTLLDRLLGGVTVTAFIFIWLSSAASPFLFAAALFWGYRLLAAAIVAITVASYAPWEHGPVSSWVQREVDRYHPMYYDGVSIVFEGGELPSKELAERQTFFAVHPHGAFCIGWSMLFTSPVMQAVRFCFAPYLYATPFFRLFSRCAGLPGSASRPAMNSYLKRGEDVALPPGGFEEATLTSTTHDRVFIKKRTGFVKLCLAHGAAIRPVYAFGERGLFANMQGMWKTRLALNRYGLPTILVWGKWFFPLLPKSDAKLHIVVGRPIVLPKIDSPTKEDVAFWHGKYIAELRRLFDEHKEDAYGPEEAKIAKLEVW